jgi:hypothetical protein
MKLRTIRNIYRELNRENFGGQLAEPTVLITRNRNIHGKVSDNGYQDPVMSFNSKKDKGLRAMRGTVYHEMVHQYLDYHLDIEDNAHHGELYWLAYFTFANLTFDWEKPEDYV